MLLEDYRVESIRRIVEAAVLAPLAENTQPWRFVSEAIRWWCASIPHGHSRMERRPHAESHRNRSGDRERGCGGQRRKPASRCRIDCRLGPDTAGCSECPNRGQIHFSDGARRDPLAGLVQSRCTARRMDHRRRVERELLGKLKACSEEFPNVEIHWVDEPRLGEFAAGWHRQPDAL